MYHQQKSVGAFIFPTSSDPEQYAILSISQGMQRSWQFKNKSCSLNTIDWTKDAYDSQAPLSHEAMPLHPIEPVHQANPCPVHTRRSWIFVPAIVPNIRLETILLVEFDYDEDDKLQPCTVEEY